MLIRHLIFMRKERGKTLEALKQILSEVFFSQKEAFKYYIKDRKKRLIDGIITRRRLVAQADNKDNFDLSKDKVSNKSVNASILHQRQPTNEKNECIDFYAARNRPRRALAFLSTSDVITFEHNRPFPSSLVPLFQSESKCETILMEMTLICMKMKSMQNSFSYEMFRA